MLTIRKSGMAVAWLICSAVMARAQTPTVVSAIVNSATKQITITGTSLTATGAPVVKLDSTTFTLVSSSSTQIVANFAGRIGGRHLPDDELCSRLGSVQNRIIFLSLVHFSPHFRFIRTEPEQGKSEDRPLLSAHRSKIDVPAIRRCCHDYTMQ